MTLFEWPVGTRFGRKIPKSKIFANFPGTSAALKKLFSSQVERIEWSHKLARKTANLAASGKIVEIQVMRVTAQQAALDPKVLLAIDRAIPHPLFFEIAHDSRIKLAAAHKRPSEAGGVSWVVESGYFESEWQPEDAPRASLPTALDMGALYERLLAPLVDAHTARLLADSALETADAARQTYAAARDLPAPLQSRIAKAAVIEAQLRAIERIEARLRREQQFNRRVEINAKLREANRKLEQLAAGSDSNENSAAP